ncbi:endonuclease/Exonuclease/phosphatase [Diplocarpon rosae]|nr:endonuclease/Exonuclease/phosphatase [Diplocarpon rosae]
MDEPAAESLDGSSIKPVSSLRSHFEQMASSKPKPPPPAGSKPISPQQTGSSVSYGGRDVVRPGSTKQEDSTFGDDAWVVRGREKDAMDNGLRLPRRASEHVSSSPTRNVHPRAMSTISPSTITPAVTIQPPQSPSMASASNFALPHSPSYLSTDSPSSASSGCASPRHIKRPSRSNTPFLETGTSPKISNSRPPSPPPPRRSSEFRRDAMKGCHDAATNSKPPPVNRADKPKISSKPTFLAARTASTTLGLGPQATVDRTSPFGSSPSSASSPENELPSPVLSRTRPWNAVGSRNGVAPIHKPFDPPPLHHSVATKKHDHETNGLNRGISSLQGTEEQRPALPIRPQAVTEPTTNRGFRDIMPPPPRPSMDRPRPMGTTQRTIPEDAPLYPTPPKRVSSTPTKQLQVKQLQTPPRHGRSATVDTTSERTPIEFRNPGVNMAPRQSLDAASVSLNVKEAEPGVYPDITRSNRREPVPQRGATELSTKHDTRIIDICGEFVCTTGSMTRVWSLLTGDILVNLAHTEGTKIISVAFKPTVLVEDEGTRLWLGTNSGDLLEVDVPTSAIVASKNSHTRRDVVRICRHLNQMWTLDDGGSLIVWAPDSTGVPSLTESPIKNFRLAKGHTFSMVVGNEFWQASGKEIRIYTPSVDGSSQLQVLQGTLSQPDTGDITSGSTIGLSEEVYFGHANGKISIYSRHDYSCLGVVNISQYKISSLTSSCGYLWAGFSTGAVYVYDTKPAIWNVKKDWQAHDSQVVKLIADKSGCWELGRVQVVSLGQDNMIRVWDGLLEADWLGTDTLPHGKHLLTAVEHHMQSYENEYANFTPIKALFMSWNAGASTPSTLKQTRHAQDANFFQDLLEKSDLPDIVVFGFQELVDLEDKKTMTKTFFTSSKKKVDPSPALEHMSRAYREWTHFLKRCMDDLDALYFPLHNSKLVGLYTMVFVKNPLQHRIRSLDQAELKRGLSGLHGNKGALIVRFVLDDTSMCFVNCHLAAGQNHAKERTADLEAIFDSELLSPVKDFGVRQDSFVTGGTGTMVMDHEICVLNGDLNYRIDATTTNNVLNSVQKDEIPKLLARDQLLRARARNPWHKMRAFDEGQITFAPTYKYDVGTDVYDTSGKQRTPAYCDRVLFRGGDRIKQLDYRREELHLSDHRPVIAEFEIEIKTMSAEKREQKWAECLEDLASRRKRLIREARQHFLVDYLGFDEVTSKKMISHLEKQEKEKASRIAEMKRENGR